MVLQTCTRMLSRTEFLFACLMVVCVIILVYTHPFLSASKSQSGKVLYSVRNSPVIQPNTLKISYFRILDVVLNGDPLQSESITLYLSTYRNHITWIAFMCFFPRSNVTTIGVIDRRSNEPLLTCLLPKIELLAIQSARHSFQISFLMKLEHSKNETYFASEQKQINVYLREKHGIAIYTMIRNKRDEIIDWIEYHRILGFEHFYLYDNLSEDRLDTFLEYYLRRDIVTVIKWPFEPMPNEHWNTIQSASMNHALKNFGPFNKWMGYFDIDEYFQLNSTNEQLIVSRKESLVDLFDRSFPVNSFPGGAQFYNCPISCFLSQSEILSSRHSNIFQKCNAVVEPRDCSTRTKLFIRPQNVPIMQNIHVFEDGVVFSAKNGLSNFGQFRHYNYGIISGQGDKRGKTDDTMDKFIVNLTARISLFYRQNCLDARIY